jgi:hypothetical protein
MFVCCFNKQKGRAMSPGLFACVGCVAEYEISRSDWRIEMATPSTSPWKEELFDFAFIPVIKDRLEELAEMAETEDWEYQHVESEYPKSILYNYLRFSYRRVAEEGKIALSEDGQYACFNTGLVTPHQEPIFGSVLIWI